MRLLRFGQRIHVFDPQLEFAVANHAEDRSGTLLQLLGGDNVMPQRRPRQKHRSLLRKHQRIKRRNRPAGSSVEHHHAARTQQVQTLFERRLAHRVIHHIHAFAAGQPFRLRLKINLRIKNDFVGSRRSRQLGFFLGRNRRNHARPNVVRHLHQQQPNSAGSGMNQRRLAFLQRIRVMRKVVRRHPL